MQTERLDVQKIKSIAINLCLGIAAIGLAVIGVASTAHAVPVLSFGAGSAVTTVDRFTNFDTIVDGQDLSAFSDNGLNVTRVGNATCEVNLCNSFGGFAGMSGGIFYSIDPAGLFSSITTTDATKIIGLEFNIGTGFFPETPYGYFEIFTNSVLVGSGSFTLSGLPTIIGFSDTNGFDELRIGIFKTPVTSFGEWNLIAADNLSVQLAPTDVPEPGTLALFAIGLVELEVLRRRRRQVA